jgi:uncharacterized protein with ParB-like and HNH nuclease domain
MPFSVKATIDGHIITAPAETAKDAFAKAIDWRIAKQIDDVSISDGDYDYSIAEFSEAMAFSEIDAIQRGSGNREH